MSEKQKKPQNGAKNTVMGATMLGNFLPSGTGEDPALGNFEPPKEQKEKESQED